MYVYLSIVMILGLVDLAKTTTSDLLYYFPPVSEKASHGKQWRVTLFHLGSLVNHNICEINNTNSSWAT